MMMTAGHNAQQRAQCDGPQHGQQRPHLAEQQGFDGQLEGLGEIHAGSPSPASSWGWTTAWGSLASPS